MPGVEPWGAESCGRDRSADEGRMSGRKHIAIVGGGLVGAVAALALQQRGFDISLIDRERPVPGPQGLGMDIRNVALSMISYIFLV